VKLQDLNARMTRQQGERTRIRLGYCKAKEGMVALKVAKEIDQLLSEVILLQRDYVARICSACEEPCCKRVQYLFDERDIIFAKVLGRNGVPRRRHNSKGCSFLSATGCLLAPKVRPFVCHRYLCSKLREEMARQDARLLFVMSKKIRILEDLRGRLWEEYLIPKEMP
jgi:hypothetical protein